MVIRTSCFLRSPPECAITVVTLTTSDDKLASLARLAGLLVRLKSGTWVRSVPFGAWENGLGIPMSRLSISCPFHSKAKRVVMRPVSVVMNASAI